MLTKIKNNILNPMYYFFNESYSELSDQFPRAIPQSPFVLRVRITSKCNLSCPFCYLKEGLNKREVGNLSIDEWEKILSKLPRYTIIDITGAEPLAAHNFMEFVELLGKMKFQYSMTTNGTLYNSKTAEHLVQSGLSCLMISLDGLSDTHNSLRGNGRAFERTTDFIKQVEDCKKRMGKKKPLIYIKSTILDENHEELKELIDYCSRSFSVDVFSFTLLFQNQSRGGIFLGQDLTEEQFLSGNHGEYHAPQRVQRSIEEILNIKDKRWNFPVVFKPRISTKDISRYIQNPAGFHVKKCPQYKNNLTIYYDGEISPCDIGLHLGNIRDYSYDFEKLYQSEKFLGFKQQMTGSHPACEGCCAGKHVPKSSRN